MKSRILGGALLIAGTSLGAGMLALPLATAASGFFHSISLFIAMWLLTVMAAYYLLETNLCLPEGSNLISMAQATLGWPGQALTWLVYLLFLYTLISAYIAGGGDLLHFLTESIHLHTPAWVDTVLFTGLLGYVVYRDITTVDWVNRGLMLVKMLAYLTLVILILPHVHLRYLEFGSFSKLKSAVMFVVVSFGYSIIIPSLRRYLHSDEKAIKATILLGSSLALICYLLWDLAVQGSIPSYGIGGLVHISTSGHATSELTEVLSTGLGSKSIARAAHLFTSICITTSFLGVSLCLADFLTDGFKLKRTKHHRYLVTALCFLPPLTLVLLFPNTFIVGLKYAGILCLILLLIIPALMAWSHRYLTKQPSKYRVWGGWPLLALTLVTSFYLLIYSFS